MTLCLSFPVSLPSPLHFPVTPGHGFRRACVLTCVLSIRQKIWKQSNTQGSWRTAEPSQENASCRQAISGAATASCSLAHSSQFSVQHIHQNICEQIARLTHSCWSPDPLVECVQKDLGGVGGRSAQESSQGFQRL